MDKPPMTASGVELRGGAGAQGASPSPASPGEGRRAGGEGLPLRRQDVDYVDFQGRKAVIDLVSGRVGLLNDVGLMVWNMCDGRTSVDEMAAALAERFPRVKEAALRADIERFLEGLREGKLLVPPED